MTAWLAQSAAILGTTILGVTGLALAWTAVQLLWGRSFPGAPEEPDVLARRGGCNDCLRAASCESGTPREEEPR